MGLYFGVYNSLYRLEVWQSILNIYTAVSILGHEVSQRVSNRSTAKQHCTHLTSLFCHSLSLFFLHQSLSHNSYALCMLNSHVGLRYMYDQVKCIYAKHTCA